MKTAVTSILCSTLWITIVISSSGLHYTFPNPFYLILQPCNTGILSVMIFRRSICLS